MNSQVDNNMNKIEYYCPSCGQKRIEDWKCEHCECHTPSQDFDPLPHLSFNDQ